MRKLTVLLAALVLSACSSVAPKVSVAETVIDSDGKPVTTEYGAVKTEKF